VTQDLNKNPVTVLFTPSDLKSIDESV